MNTTTIRTRAITALVAAGTMAGSRVEESDTRGYDKDATLPAIRVHTRETDYEPKGIGVDSDHFETVTLLIQGTAQQDDGAEVNPAAMAATLETFKRQILSALLKSAAFRADLSPITIGRGSMSSGIESDRFRGVVVVRLEITYDLDLAFDDPADPIETFDVQTDLTDPSGGPDGRSETSLTVDLT